MLRFLLVLLILIPLSLSAQCNQHVFTSVGAENWTNFQYQDCIIYCADIGTTFVLNGDGFVYPLLTEHPSYASCIPPSCDGDFDEDGIVGAEDLLIFLSNYGQCEN